MARYLASLSVATTAPARPDDIERGHLDVEGDDHDEARHADVPAQYHRERAAHGGQP